MPASYGADLPPPLPSPPFLPAPCSAITENTRACYPIEFIPNARIPCAGPHPRNIIMLCCDAFGVLPPVSRLSAEQAMYYFIRCVWGVGVGGGSGENPPPLELQGRAATLAAGRAEGRLGPVECPSGCSKPASLCCTRSMRLVIPSQLCLQCAGCCALCWLRPSLPHPAPAAAAATRPRWRGQRWG